MAHQLIEIILPEGRSEDIGELLHDIAILASWQDHLENISPATWWEKDKARRASRRATIILFVLLLMLAGVLFIHTGLL